MRLSVEAIQVGHEALSETVIMNADVVRQSRSFLLPGGRFVTQPTAAHTLAARLLASSNKFLWDAMTSGGSGSATVLLESIREEERLRQAGQAEGAEEFSEEKRAYIAREVRTLPHSLLKDMVQRQQQRRPAAQGDSAAAQSEAAGGAEANG